MPRIRAIKPEFWSTPNPPPDPATRLLYIAMWNWADDNGIGTCVERELMGFAFPYDDITVGVFRRHLGAIHRHFGVVFYVVRGRPYYSIPSWNQHQKSDPRFKGRHPGPNEAEELLYQDILDDVGVSHRHVGGTQENFPAGTGEQGNRGTGEQLTHSGKVTTRGTELANQASAVVLSCVPSDLPRKEKQLIYGHVLNMFHEGIPEDLVRETISVWNERENAGPGLLPHLVSEAVKRRSPKVTRNDKVIQDTLEAGKRLAARAKALEP